jgi:hypothetical protein
MSPIISPGTGESLSVNPACCGDCPGDCSECPSTLTATVTCPSGNCMWTTSLTLSESECMWSGQVTDMFALCIGISVSIVCDSGYWKISVDLSSCPPMHLSGGMYMNTNPIPGGACPPTGSFAMTKISGTCDDISPVVISM